MVRIGEEETDPNGRAVSTILCLQYYNTRAYINIKYWLSEREMDGWMDGAKEGASESRRALTSY